MYKDLIFNGGCTLLDIWSLSHVRLLLTPWTVACQAPLSMGILKARRILEWVVVPSSPRNLPNTGTETASVNV